MLIYRMLNVLDILLFFSFSISTWRAVCSIVCTTKNKTVRPDIEVGVSSPAAFVLLFFFRRQFHKSCIDEWLVLKKLCPLCNTSVEVAADSHVTSATAASAAISARV